MTGVSVEPKINILNLKSWLWRIDQGRLTLRSQISSHIVVWCSLDSLSVISAWHVCLAVYQEWISLYLPAHFILLNLKRALNHIWFIVIKRRSHIDLSQIVFLVSVLQDHGFSKWLQERLDIILIFFLILFFFIHLYDFINFLNDLKAPILIMFKFTVGEVLKSTIVHVILKSVHKLHELELLSFFVIMSITRKFLVQRQFIE